MLFTKHKKIIVCLAAVAVMSLGGAATAMAAPAGISLTLAGTFDPSKADIKPGTYTVVEGAHPHLEGGQTSTTAPNPTLTNSSGVPVAAVSTNVDASDFLGDNFTVETLGPQDLHPLTSGQNDTTAAK